jgi:phospholipid/cholesterol/gamma-HCH transport system substrate-binding protein
MSEKTENTSKAKGSIGIELWVGLFVIIGMACFAYLAINIASIRFSDAGYYRITARFSDVSGLKLGAPLEIAGVRIGQVENVTLDNSEAIVTLQVRDGYSLRDDDIVQIRTKGIIGDKYVRVSPGASDMKIEEGGVIYDTESSVDFEEIVGKFIHNMNSGKVE